MTDEGNVVDMNSGVVRRLMAELRDMREEMREGFQRVDERFAQVDERIARFEVRVEARFNAHEALFRGLRRDIERGFRLHEEANERIERLEAGRVAKADDGDP